MKRNKIPKASLLLTFCLLTSIAFSQSFQSSVVATTGAYFTSSAGSLDWTLGEISTETYQQPVGYLTQGFQQSFFIEITGLAEEIERVSVYPNPVKDILYLEAADMGNYSIELYNLQGQRLVDIVGDISSGVNARQIDMKEFRAAVYLLRLTNSITKKNYSIKIEKL